ncbi:MAG TPA: hypothetical protein VGL94_22325 [Ktedonobacteraceae bacterium]|jgi:hypothetical protein
MNVFQEITSGADDDVQGSRLDERLSPQVTQSRELAEIGQDSRSMASIRMSNKEFTCEDHGNRETLFADDH